MWRTVRNRLRGVECPLVAGRGAVARLILDVRTSGWRPPSDGDLAADRHWRAGRWAEGPARGQGRLTARAPEVWVRCSTISSDAACAIPISSPSMARRGWRARSLLCGTACQRSSAQCTGSAACWRMRRSGCTRHAVCSRPKPSRPRPRCWSSSACAPTGRRSCSRARRWTTRAPEAWRTGSTIFERQIKTQAVPLVGGHSGDVVLRIARFRSDQ